MAIKASAAITLSSVVDVWSTTRYYLLQSSTQAAPAKPTTNPPTGGWNDTEPTYTSGSTNTLYFTDLTVFSDGSWAYSMVSVSSAYEAAKAAWNKAQAAQNAVTALDDALTQQEIFNRLTDNGAAQGMVLYNGQLYINATYINAGMLNVGLINFRDYTPPYKVPNEFDLDSLFSDQVIQDGWIVNRDGSSDIGIIGCNFGDAVPLRGRTLTVTLTSRSHITTESGGYDYIDEHGEIWTETLPETDTPAYGSEDAEGNLNGATDNGEYEQYSTSYRVPDNAMGFYLAVRCTGVKNIAVSESYSKNFGLRYGNNIGLNYKGLQVGKFVVDRSGNATFNGDAIFNGNTKAGNLAVEYPDDAYVVVKNTDTGALVYLDSAGNGKHGVWSDGYYTGSAFVENGKFIISRNADGKVTVADHYNKDEVNALGVLYTDVNIGNVTVNGSGYMDIRNKIPSGITPIAALIQDFGTATGAITVTANGAYILGTPNATVTNVTIRYFYRGQ